jgi:hypothetical protein
MTSIARKATASTASARPAPVPVLSRATELSAVVVAASLLLVGLAAVLYR